MPTVSLSDALLLVAETLAARAGFKTAEDYVAELVRRDLEQFQQKDPDYFLRQAMADSGDPAAVTAEALQKRKREIETLLLEGLNSGPATPMTAENWVALRQRVASRLARRDGQ
jgi:hypothetical protein